LMGNFSFSPHTERIAVILSFTIFYLFSQNKMFDIARPPFDAFVYKLFLGLIIQLISLHSGTASNYFALLSSI
jgi:hypothetical protein